MKVGTRVLMTLLFCTGTVGATGFGGEEERPLAWPLFLVGVIGVGTLGVATKSAARKRGGDGEASHGEKKRFRELIDTLRDRVVELDEQHAALDAEETRRRIDRLLANEYFDLTSQNEDLVALIGFNDYSRVWEGVATAERLLARAWSLATDGWAEEGFAEIPRARACLERAAAAMATV